MEVHRQGVRFFVDAGNAPSEEVQWWLEGYASWEMQTFRVLDACLSPRSSYLDVGAWVGPTVLYAAARARRVLCLEPDPVAYTRLLENIRVNPQYDNIIALDYCLADTDGERRFGGNGALGNSESTMLVDEQDYAERVGELPRKRDAARERAWRSAASVMVRTITIERLAAVWDLSDCRFVKIDIEGGEKIVVPAMRRYLEQNRPSVYLALHWVYLRSADIAQIVHALLNIYGAIYRTDLQTRVSPAQILEARIEEIVCLGDGA